MNSRRRVNSDVGCYVKILRLADTSIRLYRKKNGQVSLHLRSYLMIDTNVGFRLSAYLRDISCKLTLTTGQVVIFDDISWGEWTFCKYERDTMVHEFLARAIADMPTIADGIGTLRVDYRFSFTNHPSEGFESFEVVVPLIKRTTVFDSQYKRTQQLVGPERRGRVL